VRERHGRAHHGLPAGVEVDSRDHAATQLEEVGPDRGDVLQGREAGAGVVDRDQRPALDPGAQPLAQRVEVVDGVLMTSRVGNRAASSIRAGCGARPGRR
jgi:hypothetical protein